MRLIGYFFLFGLFLVPGVTFSAPASIQIEWSHRQVPHINVDPNIPEGSLFVTFSSDQTIIPVSPPEGIEFIDSSTWRMNIQWYDLDPQTILFTNSENETTQVTTNYSPRMPLDPLLHDLPVLHVITPPENLWDSESGIYVFGLNDNCLQHGVEWEKPAAFHYFEGSNSPLISEQIGLRIHGGYSRRADQKGFRYYFDDYGSADSLEFDFFGGQPSSFQRLITRTGHWPNRCFTSVLAEGMFMDLGHLASRNRDIVVYLNNEYWGFLTLRERIDEKFIEHTHGLGGNGYNLIKDGYLLEGDENSWWEFLQACRGDHEFASHQWFTYVTENLDLATYLDWLLINIFGATGDNGGPHNLTLLQLESEPWKYIMFDEDLLFKNDNLQSDFFRFFSCADEDEYYQYLPPICYVPASTMVNWAAPFRGLMQNSEFKILFKNRFEYLMANELSVEALQNRLGAIAANQSPEMPRHHERWGQWVGYYDSAVNQTMSWFESRTPIVLNQFDSFLEQYRVDVELSQFQGEHSSDGVNLIWRTESEQGVLGFNLYRGNSPEAMDLIASFTTHDELLAIGDLWQMADYNFLDENAVPDLPQYYQLAKVETGGDEESLPWLLKIEIMAQPLATLKINEFLALNSHGIEDETGTPEDWVEIFNVGGEAVDLHGMHLTDDQSEPTKWQFPSVNLAPGGYLIVWCDSDPEEGPLHTNFKLSASGEYIGLYESLDNGGQLIDSYNFGSQEADISEGRLPDGGVTWITFTTPTPGFTNQGVSAAGNLPVSPLSLGPNHPNPFNPVTTINFHLSQPGNMSLDIFDINGRKVRTLIDSIPFSIGQHQVAWDGCGEGGQLLASGTYFALATTRNTIQTLKLSLIK